MASNVNILANIMEDGTQSTALSWINKADEDTDYSSWRNRYGETIAQLGVIPAVAMPKVVIELIKKWIKNHWIIEMRTITVWLHHQYIIKIYFKP
jgi:hypothetical protein